jgi:hypothetical protein
VSSALTSRAGGGVVLLTAHDYAEKKLIAQVKILLMSRARNAGRFWHLAHGRLYSHARRAAAISHRGAIFAFCW